MKLCEVSTTISYEHDNKILATVTLWCHRKVKLKMEDFKEYVTENNMMITFSDGEKLKCLTIGKYHDNFEQAVEWSIRIREELNYFMGNL